MQEQLTKYLLMDYKIIVIQTFRNECQFMYNNNI
jgi:hypothetical protein